MIWSIAGQEIVVRSDWAPNTLNPYLNTASYGLALVSLSQSSAVVVVTAITTVLIDPVLVVRMIQMMLCLR